MSIARRTNRPNGTELRVQKELVADQVALDVKQTQRVTVDMPTQQSASSTGLSNDNTVRHSTNISGSQTIKKKITTRAAGVQVTVQTNTELKDDSAATVS